MHAYATHLMEAYGEQCIVVEPCDELAVTLRFRISVKKVVDLDSMQWDYRLEDRSAWIGIEECEISSIKWQVIMESY
jgi:hypothetical protein